MKKIKRLVIAIRDYYLINNTGLFDPHYYLANNPDVRRADINPLKHYVKHGGLEGRNPSEIFDAAFYINAYHDVRAAGINPLAHFILYGQKEGRRGLVKSKKSIETSKFERIVNSISKNVYNLFGDSLMIGQKNMMKIKNWSFLFRTNPLQLAHQFSDTISSMV